MPHHEEPDGTVRVWEHIGVTIPVGDGEPYAYLKVEVGHERLSPSNDPQDISRTYRSVRRRNDTMMTKRVEEFKKLLRGVR